MADPKPSAATALESMAKRVKVLESTIGHLQRQLIVTQQSVHDLGPGGFTPAERTRLATLLGPDGLTDQARVERRATAPQLTAAEQRDGSFLRRASRQLGQWIQAHPGPQADAMHWQSQIDAAAQPYQDLPVVVRSHLQRSSWPGEPLYLLADLCGATPKEAQTELATAPGMPGALWALAKLLGATDPVVVAVSEWHEALGRHRVEHGCGYTYCDDPTIIPFPITPPIAQRILEAILAKRTAAPDTRQQVGKRLAASPL